MLTFDQIDSLSDPILELYERYLQSVINDIARRLVGMDMTSMAAWQLQRMIESGRVYDHALKELSKLTGKSERELKKLFKAAGIRATTFDDAIYKAAGLKPLPLNLSPAMAQVLAAGLRKTGNVMRNLTMTTAISAQDLFIQAADLAYMQVSSGAFDYISAIRNAVKDVASKGLQTINYASGKRDQLDVAMRRTVLTGVSQTAGNLQLTRADEMNQDLVQVSAHIGARNVGEGPRNHESWQGKVYSRSRHDTEYPNFYTVTGYGTAEGLHGVNCRHSFYPFFEGISERIYSDAELESYANKTVTYNGKEMSVYEATQVQRGIERKIRHWKRQAGALDAANLDTEYEKSKVRQWQGEMRGFIKQMDDQYKKEGIKWHRQYEREQVPAFVSPESVDRDLRLAQEEKLFDLQSVETDTVFSKPIDYSVVYGKDVIKSSQTVIDLDRKAYIKRDHDEDIDWLMKNQDLVLKAINNPLFVEKIPRAQKKAGFNIAHIVHIGEKDLPFLNVVLNFRSGKQSSMIWTMFRVGKNYIYELSGETKSRWRKP